MEREADFPPYLTSDLPGIGGEIRQSYEDFLVEEVPLYKPCGTGTHLYLFIEKRGIPTFELINRLARALERQQRDFGVAGLKDADAITRQYVSIEHVPLAQAKALDLDNIRILDMSYHQNKLKMGHLKGNRFEILIRSSDKDALQKGRKIMERLEQTGAPNYFGPQRFGNLGTTHLLGEALLKKDDKGFADILINTARPDMGESYQKVRDLYVQGDFKGALVALDDLSVGARYERKLLSVLANRGGDFKKAAASLDKRILKFYFSAFQSHYFNRVLERRLPNIDRVEKGDAAYIHQKGACFLVEDPSKENQRAKSFEISPTGPIFGHKMLQTLHKPGDLENQVLKETGFDLHRIRGRYGIRLRGARRPLRIPMKDWALTQKETGLLVSFFLPQGAYATIIARELTKSSLR